jgi:hypothetical protein
MKRDANDILREHGPDALRAEFDRARKYEGEANGDGRRHDRGWHYYDDTPPPPMRWLIKGILPETGVGILSGQWGTFKTTTALDLSVSVMTGMAFAARYRVVRARSKHAYASLPNTAATPDCYRSPGAATARSSPTSAPASSYAAWSTVRPSTSISP